MEVTQVIGNVILHQNRSLGVCVRNRKVGYTYFQTVGLSLK